MRRLVLLPLLVAALTWPASSQAFVACSNSAGTLTVGMNQTDDSVRIARGAVDINVIATGVFGEGPNILVNCRGEQATVTNTDLIVINEAATVRSSDVILELGAGAIGPGATPEADGTSEIEIQANLFGSGSALELRGSSGRDVFHAGRAPGGLPGVNLNAGAEPAPDVDLEMSGVEALGVFAGGGRDVFRGRGGRGFAGPLQGLLLFGVGGPGGDLLVAGRTPAILSGGGGRDRLFGSSGADLFNAGPGRDFLRAGRGRDEVFTHRGGRDRVDCGAGIDGGLVDRKDKLRGCERVKTRLPRLEDILDDLEGAPTSPRRLSTAMKELRGK